MRPRRWAIVGLLASERGSGTILAVGVAAALVVIAGVALPLSLVFVERHALAGAADAAALAAADTAVGIHGGFPCDAATRVAASNGAQLTGCDVDGLVVTVSVGSSILGLTVTARATAGPAPGESD